MSNDDRAILATFIAAQQLRSPKIRDSQRILINALAEKAMAIAPEASNLAEIQASTHIDAVKVNSMQVVTKGTGKIAETLFSYRWSLHIAPEDLYFWISDCPVVMHNQENFGPYSNLGIEVPGIQIGMPLSPKLWLSIWHPKIIKDINDRNNEMLAHHRELRAAFLLGVKNNRDELKIEIEEIEKHLSHVAKLIANLDHGTALQETPENVEHFNALQYDWALRFIVSKKRNFELADKIRADNPKAGIEFRVN